MHDAGSAIWQRQYRESGFVITFLVRCSLISTAILWVKLNGDLLVLLSRFTIMLEPLAITNSPGNELGVYSSSFTDLLVLDCYAHRRKTLSLWLTHVLTFLYLISLSAFYRVKQEFRNFQSLMQMSIVSVPRVPHLFDKVSLLPSKACYFWLKLNWTKITYYYRQ